MADYNISWQSGGTEGLPGKTNITLPENQKDYTSTSLSLTGKNLPDYGEIQQENFIRLLENFASATPPEHATIGQLWYDTRIGVLKIRVDYSVDSWANLATIPNLNGNSGKFLSNDGLTLSWANAGYTLPTASTSLLGGVKIDGSTIVINNGVISVTPSGTIPSQTGNSGKFLTTNGSALSWANIYESPNFARLNADQTFTGANTFTQGPVLAAGVAGGLVYLDSNKKMTGSSSLGFTGSSAIPAIVFSPSGSSSATIDTDANRLQINSSDKKIALATSNGTIIIGEGAAGAPSAQIYARSSLGTSVGDISDILKLTIATQNIDTLRFFKVRTSNGNGWESAGYRIQSHVDSTSQAYIQFNGGNDSGLSFGTGNSNVSPLGVPERLRIDQLGNVGIGTAGAASGRLDVRAEAGRTSLFLSDNVNSSLAIKHESPGMLTYESIGGTQQRWVVGGQQVMKLDNWPGSLNLYRELLIRPAAGSTDLPDIIWMSASDTERHRLYEAGDSNALWYRKNGGGGGLSGAIHYDGNTTSTCVSFQSAYGFTNGQGWTNDSNFTDVFPPAGYTMANLQSYIASIAGIHFNGKVDNNDSMRCIAAPLGDRIRIYVQNTEQRDLPSANFLAIWRR